VEPKANYKVGLYIIKQKNVVLNIKLSYI